MAPGSVMSVATGFDGHRKGDGARGSERKNRHQSRGRLLRRPRLLLLLLLSRFVLLFLVFLLLTFRLVLLAAFVAHSVLLPGEG